MSKQNQQHFARLCQLSRINRFSILIVLLVTASLLASTFLVSGAGKAKAPENKNKQTLKCPANGFTKKILPLNRGKVPSPPVPAKFLGLSSASFAASINMFNYPSQWCWGSTCSHIALYCIDGNIQGGPCCFHCSNQWGTSEDFCCACSNGC